MEQNLQIVLDLINADANLSPDEKAVIIARLNAADKKMGVDAFRIERGEHLKKTMSVLLDETIEELEQKRKAVEEKNRDLEIEAALERVRTIAMGMRAADDLLNICKILFEELTVLGFGELRNAMINIVNDEKGSFLNYDFNGSDALVIPFQYNSHPVIERQVNITRSAGDAFIEHILTGSDLEDFKAFRVRNGEAPDPKLENIAALYYYFYSIGVGSVGISTFSSLTEEKLSVLKRFRNVFDLAYRRYVDIKQAEAQAREAQIEVALERVRARTMAMQRSEELSETAYVLHQQFTSLGETPLQITIGIINPEDRTIAFWGTDLTGHQTEITAKGSVDEPFLLSQLFTAWQKKQKSAMFALSGKELKGWVKYRQQITGMVSPDDEMEGTRYVYLGYFSKGAISISTEELLPDETIKILERFAAVFDGTYTRFNDLQKAEAQAREAKIEASLERVRSRTMGMQKSEELLDVIQLLSEQLLQLNFNIGAATFALNYKESDDFDLWMAVPGQAYLTKIHIPYIDHPMFNSFIEAKENGWDFLAQEFTFEQKNKWFDHFFENTPAAPDEEKEFVYSSPGYAASNVLMEAIALGIANLSGVPYSGAENSVLKRFANVFDQTYTRFNDLKQAEAQAREAQIELALERVRARTMAMQRSEELAQTAYILFQQFKELGENPDQTTIGIINEAEHVIEYWVTMYGSQVNKVFKFSIDEPNVTNKIYQAWKAKKTSLVIDLSGKALLDFTTFRASMGGAGFNPAEKRRVINVAFFSRGLINVQSNEARSAESIRLLERFAKVFEQTYTRFLDLQKAETQAREARIEATLEKVRSRSLAMHKSGELHEVVILLAEKLQELNVEMEGAVIFLPVDDKRGRGITMWAAMAAQMYAPPLFVPYEHPLLVYIPEAWENGTDYIARSWPYEEKTDFWKWAFEHSDFKHIPEHRKAQIMAAPAYALSAAFSKNSAITIPSHTGQILADEDAAILKRFAVVFDQAYVRFLDLQKAEVQAREAQIEAALERTRTQSMIMQHSSELDDTLRVFHQQLLHLGIHSAFSFLWLPDEEKDRHIFWAAWAENNSSDFKSKAIDYPLDRNEPATKQCLIDWKGKEPIVSYHVPPEGVAGYFAAWQELIEGVEQLKPEYFKGGLYYVEAFMKYGCFGVMVENSLSPEETKILGRFAIEFERTYTRFLDLQKAEAQARESQIQLALERVRARTMAMQHSEELGEAASLLFEQVQGLGLKTGSCGYNIWDKDKKATTVWVSSQGGGLQPPFKMPHTENITYRHVHAAMKRGDDFFTEEVRGKALQEHFDYLLTVPGIQDIILELINDGYAFPVVMDFNIVFFAQGYLSFHTHEPCPQAYDIFKRFAKVFEQTYTRFLDLQKAEAQAREAQIELSLERVRASAMAMHKTDQLLGAAELLYRELTGLGISSMAVTYAIMTADEKSAAYYSINPVDGKINPVPLDLPHTETDVMRSILASWKKQETFSKLALDEKATLKHQTYIAGKIQAFFAKHNFDYNFSVEAFLEISPKKAVIYTFNFTQGYIFVIGSDHLTKPQEEMVIRFAKVFEMTYRRFLDLKQAEEQARESQIQLALERVRSRTMAMQNSEELHEVIQLIFDQFQQLNFDIDVANFALNYKETDDFDLLLAVPHGKYPMKIHVPYLKHPVFDRFNKTKKEGGLLTDVFTKKEKDSFFKHFFKYVPGVPEETKATIFGRPGFVRSTALMKNTALTIHNYNGIPYSEAENNTLLRFGQVFEQTYTRFTDLEQAEAQAREGQIQLGLERVRAATMAMHDSAGVGDATALVFTELYKLGISTIRCGVCIVDGVAKEIEVWSASQQGEKLSRGIGRLDMTAHPLWVYLLKAWKDQKSSFTYELKGKELADYYHIIRTAACYHAPDNKAMYDPAAGIENETQYCNCYIFKEGCLFTFTHEPFSSESDLVLEKFAAVFGLTYRRFLDLQRAEAQAREAQIEAALERVRSKTMAMHSSQDVGETVILMFNELVKLGVEKIARCGIAMPDNNGVIELWTAKLSKNEKEEIIIGHIDTAIHPMLSLLYDAWKSKQAHFEYVLEGDDLTRYIKALNNSPDYPIKYNMEAWGAKQYHNDFFFNEGMVFAFTSQPLSAEISSIFQRFSGVFGQTYRRYLDLQKAEAQAKEAQIQLALERVRARTMAMQKSDELAEASVEVFKQLMGLGIQPNRLFIGIIKDNSGDIELWATEEDGSKISSRFTGNMHGNRSVKKMYDGWKAQKKSLTIDMKGAELTDYFKYLVEELKVPFKLGLSQKRRVQSIAYFSQGFIGMAAPEPQPEETISLMERFAGVFNLTYTRFNDLKLAEEQAREARIEASLERVRGKAMAMRNSNDLSITASMVFTELRNLGINPIRSGVGLITKGTRQAKIYSDTSLQKDTDLSLMGEVTLSGHPVFELQYQAWLKQENCFAALEGAELAAYYKILSVGLNANLGAAGKTREKEYGHWFMFSEGFLYAWSDKAYTEAEIKILERFKNVVELTFRRYIELQQSEAVARDAVREASLDRVRAEIASMRKRSDLERITPLIWDELTILGIPFIRCGVFIMDEAQELIHTFLSTPDGKAIGAFHIPFDTSGNFEIMVNSWRHNEPYIDHWKEEAFSEFADTLVKQGAISSKAQYMRTLPHEGVHLNFLPFLQGMLYVGNSSPLAEDDIDLIQAVAEAFSTAYARYEDFNKLEAAKQQVDNTLADLKATQTKLIQSEKMASLGELTAGIAHEIQNPLNFVNNFSEVNQEMIDELADELKAGNIEEALAIAADIKDNEQKINHHGKRADGIVKGMLQHSRTGGGEKQPTNMNALADEFLRLSYHGLRAKDKSFNAELVTNFDAALPKINVIGQDMGRVMLNLFNNAFYAVNQKMKTAAAGYKPEVAVTTFSENGQIIIKVKDNGVGMPDAIKEKIMQPFFTTKPTGEGTGLGLSLTYDMVVKGHGGTIQVNSKEGEGSEFIIQLPIN